MGTTTVHDNHPSLLISSRILGAAAENHSLSFFDPLRPPDPILIRSNAHRDCVNCIRFLDTRLFATCSDDHTVKLWDLRQMKSEVRTLKGHTNWVKNVEFVRDKAMLITSGFDHSVMAWDVNDFSSAGVKLLSAEGLMRMRLSPQADRLLISSQYGYLLIIHHLDLNRLAADLRGFRPNNYWISIETQSMFPTVREHLQRFTADRNRTELITDFPTGCDPDHITCIAPHPYGWAIAARMNNMDGRKEWTTVHDLQLPVVEPVDDQDDRIKDDDDDDDIAEDEDERRRAQSTVTNNRSTVFRVRRPAPRLTTSEGSLVWSDDIGSSSSSEDEMPLPQTLSSSYIGSLRNSFTIARNSRTTQSTVTAVPHDVASIQSHIVHRQTPTSVHRPVSRIIGSSSEQRRPSRFRIINSIHPERPGRTVVIFDDRTRINSRMNDTLPSAPSTYNRLRYFKEEPSLGRGFIKELCWSPDGRVIVSPYAFGIRLLSFDADCSEMSDVQWKAPLVCRQLTELRTLIGTPHGHNAVVLCAQFSPTHQALLATGCQQGKVSFCQPKL